MKRRRRGRLRAEAAPKPSVQRTLHRRGLEGPEGVQRGSRGGPEGVQRGSRGGPEGVQRGSRGGPEGVQRETAAVRWALWGGCT
eukprot:1193908-Prorocentrum_minimum.AAC.3